MHGRGACVAKGGVHGKGGCAWQRGACIAKGRHVWQGEGGVCGWGCAWLGGMHGEGGVHGEGGHAW